MPSPDIFLPEEKKKASRKREIQVILLLSK